MRRRVTFCAVAAAVAGAIATVALASFVFTGRYLHDDEGYVLISLRGWITGHPLYRDVYSQYGPGFFVVVGGVFKALGPSHVTIFAARVATVVLGLITAGSLGYATARIARSPYAGVLAGVGVAVCSAAGMESALHPTHVVQALIGCAVAAVVVLDERRTSRAAAVALGAAVALCVLVKVNAGGLLLVAVAVGMGLTARGRTAVTRLIVPVAVVGVVAIVAKHGGYPTQLFALLLAAGVVVLLGARVELGDALPVAVPTVAAAVTGVAVIGVVLACGTSVTTLVAGTVTDATHLARAFTVPLDGARYTAIPLLMIAVAAWFVHSERSQTLRGSALVLLGLGAIGAAYNQRFSAGTLHGVNTLVLGAALSWTALGGARKASSSRAVACSLCLLLPLIVYPVAGAQRAAGSLLFPVVGAIAIVDGGRLLADAGAISFERVIPVLLSVTALMVGAVALHSTLIVRANSVALPYSSALVRTSSSDARDVERLVGALQDCDTFFALPGLNSFYFLAHQAPPTWQNAGAWTNLFDANRQARTVRDLRRTKRLCVVRNRPREKFWLSGGREQTGPLRAFLETKAELVATVGDYSVYR